MVTRECRGWKPASAWKFMKVEMSPMWLFVNMWEPYVQSAIRQDTRHFDAFWMMDLEGRGGIHTLRKSTNSGTSNNSLWKLQQQQLYHPFKRQASNSPNHWAPYLLKASQLGILENSQAFKKNVASHPELLRLWFLIAEILGDFVVFSVSNSAPRLIFWVCIHPHHPKYEVIVMAQNKGSKQTTTCFFIFNIGRSISGVLSFLT